MDESKRVEEMLGTMSDAHAALDANNRRVERLERGMLVMLDRLAARGLLSLKDVRAMREAMTASPADLSPARPGDPVSVFAQLLDRLRGP